MCGIAGFITRDGRSPDAQVLRRMCDAMVHRGPDGMGQFIDHRVALGHRRLSIIDIETGSQPIANEDGRYQVILNGEIYNYLELRKDLLARGHRFRTNSDTEVLVHLYEDVGVRITEYLNGMFAFAIWDCRDQSLFLARDRFGKKPVYYSTDIPGFDFAFASELKALALLPGTDLAVRPESIADFLAFSYVPDPHTIYKHFHKLPPATSLSVAGNRMSMRKYWQLEFSAGDSSSFDTHIAALDELADDAVSRRMISDVPLGAFLSGGVDSSGIVAYMTRHASAPVLSFSIGFREQAFDETSYARLIVDRYRTEHYEKVVTPAIGEMLPVLAYHFDEPFGDSSAVPSLYLSRMTRERVTVALSGDGGDELFGGYRRYRFGVAEERTRRLLPGRWARGLVGAIGRIYPKLDYLPRPFRAKATLLNLSLDIGDAYYASMTAFRDSELTAVLSPGFKAQLADYNPREGFRDRFKAVSHLPPLQQMQAVDVDTYLPGDILVKADRTSMAYSLESRAPWLDYRIGELAARISQQDKIRGLQGKFIFKKLLEPHVPADILWRPKMGFSAPVAAWFRSDLRPVFERLVLSGMIDEMVDTRECSRIWRQHLSGTWDHSRKLWDLLMLASWNWTHRQKMPASELLDATTAAL